MIDHAFDEHASLALLPALLSTGFVNVLRLLALVLIALGCSRPLPKDVAPEVHDAPPARDADADALDAALPADAVESLGAAWEHLRGKRDRDALRVAARVLSDEIRGAETRVVLDQGRDAGVQPGWRGRSLDDRGTPTVELEVFEVERSRAKARTTATHDRIARERRVILWDPNRGALQGW